MRGVQYDHVDPCFAQRLDALEGIRRRADRRPDAQAPTHILARSRKFRGLLKILDRDHALELVVAIDDQDFLDAVLVQQSLHFLFGRIFTHRDEARFGRHDRADRGIECPLEAQVAVGDDADDFAAADHGDA